MLLPKLQLVAGTALIALVVIAVPAQAADAPAPAKSAVPKKIEFSDFKIITDRNIFNPRRYARGNNSERRETARPRSVESLTLVGIMSYEKGWFAFFDGTSSAFRKAAQPNEKVGGFTVTEISPMQVTLAWETNSAELRVGMQMRREEGGEWRTNAAPEPALAAYVAPVTARPTVAPSAAADASSPGGEASAFPAFVGGADQPTMIVLPADGQGSLDAGAGAISLSATNNAPSGAPGGENDVLRRLMQRREQELNK